MPWWTSLLGVPLIVAALRDIFHTLWHPSGRGTLSARVTTMVWQTLRRGRRRPTTVGGPLGMLAVVGTWAGLIVLGWALFYWPHVEAGFSYSPGLRPGTRSDFLDALYLSLVTLTTLGFGDVVPTAGWLRLATPLEALIGFGLLTAAVTWVLQIYPALARRRALAIRLALLERTEAVQTIPALDSTTAAQVLEELVAGTVQARVDLTQYPETYYFREADASASLAAMLPYADALAAAAQHSRRPDVRFAADNLSAAVRDLTRLVDEEFLHVGAGHHEVLAAYVQDHRGGGRMR